MAGVIALDRCASEIELRTIQSPWGQSVRCHRRIKARLKFAFALADEFAPFKPQRIDSFNCRLVRGSNTISNHGRGCAWDVFHTAPGVPPPGGVWHPDDTFGERFALPFTLLGFTWGSKWQRQDWPHLEWSGANVPRLTRRERREIRKRLERRFGKGNK